MNKKSTGVKIKTLPLAKKASKPVNSDVSNKTPVDKREKPLPQTRTSVIRPAAGLHSKHQDKCAIEKQKERPNVPKSPMKKVKKSVPVKNPMFEVVVGAILRRMLLKSLSLKSALLFCAHTAD